jgi:hypothetical protein
VADSDPFVEQWEAPAQAGLLADAIEAYVRQYDHVTFTELQRRLEPYFDVRGTFALELRSDIFLWAEMSEAFVDAIEELRLARRIWLCPTSVLTYLFDGGGLALPIAKRLPKGGYASARWLPVTLRVVAP